MLPKVKNYSENMTGTLSIYIYGFSTCQEKLWNQNREWIFINRNWKNW